ncbi:MAG: FAD-dependent monooxygenase [Pseudomonadota bacterium]
MAEDILIAGAGIGGLASALALAQGGNRVRVLEQASDIEEIGAGLQLGPNAADVLQRLGVDEEVSALAGFPDEVRILDGLTGRRLNRVVLDEEFRARFGAPYRVIHRGDLLGILHRACDQHSAIAIETGAKLKDFKTEEDMVLVESQAGPRTAHALIGADGIHSTVREKLLGDGPAEFAGHVIARSLIPAQGMPLKDNAVCLWLLPGGHIVHYPVRGGEQFNLVVAWDEIWQDEGWSARAIAHDVTAVAKKAVKPLRSVLDAAPSWRKWAAADRPPSNRWGKGRVTLVGDAAHPVLPYLAQGAVMALEDAVVLADCVAHEPELRQALRAYEHARKPRLARMHEMCRKAGLAYHAGGGFRFIRNLILRTMSGKASRNRVAWIYDWRL